MSDVLPAAPPFLDRTQAGHELADRLGFLAGREDLTIVGLAPGGVPVAAELAEALDAALEVMVVRPLIVPGPSELSIGAVTSGGTRSVDLPAVKRYHLPNWAPSYLAEVEEQEAAREESLIRDHPIAPDLRGRTVVLVDDGLSSGPEILAAAEESLVQVPANLIVASPVLANPVADELRSLGVEVDCLFADEVERRGAGPFWYADTAVPKPAAIRSLLGSARRRSHWRDEVANA
ncbi:MAG TPA: phosphoribosyltransferase family protein [Candidatus Dormibacteraeota bacterium]